MILQLCPEIWVETPLGVGHAIIYRDDGNDYYWTVILQQTRAIVVFRNDQIRAAKSYTHGRGISNTEMTKIIA